MAATGVEQIRLKQLEDATHFPSNQQISAQFLWSFSGLTELSRPAAPTRSGNVSPAASELKAEVKMRIFVRF